MKHTMADYNKFQIIRDVIIILWVLALLLQTALWVTKYLKEQERQTELLQAIHWQLIDVNKAFNEWFIINN